MYFEIARDDSEYIIFLTGYDGRHYTAMHPYARSQEEAESLKVVFEEMLVDPTLRIEVEDQKGDYAQCWYVTDDRRYPIGPCVGGDTRMRVAERIKGYFV